MGRWLVCLCCLLISPVSDLLGNQEQSSVWRKLRKLSSRFRDNSFECLPSQGQEKPDWWGRSHEGGSAWYETSSKLLHTDFAKTENGPWRQTERVWLSLPAVTLCPVLCLRDLQMYVTRYHCQSRACYEINHSVHSMSLIAHPRAQ